MAHDQAASLRQKVRQVDSRPLWAVAALGRRAKSRPFAMDITRAAGAREIPLALLGAPDEGAGTGPILVPAGDGSAVRWGVMRGADAWCVFVETSEEGVSSFLDLLAALPPGRAVYLALGPVSSLDLYHEALSRLTQAAGEAGSRLHPLGAYVVGEGLVLTETVLFGEEVPR